MANLFKAKNVNMLEGRVLPKVFAFVLPLMLTNLLQAFYSAADMIVVSLSNVEGAVGAIGTTTSLINLINNIFIGFSIGANVIVAKRLGRNSVDHTEKAVHTSIIISAIFGLVCMAVGLFASSPILKLMGDEGHILELASTYTFYCFLGVPFMAISNNLIAIFRAKGDTKTPLYVLTSTGALNIMLNLFFVLVCRMSVAGVAIATAAANAVSAVVLLYILSKDTGVCKFSFKKLRLNKRAFIDILCIGLPASVQGALFSLSNIIIQSSIIGINNMVCPGGSAIIDGNSAASSLETFIYTATNSVYTASVTFVSQHHGARKYKRIGSVMRSCYFVTFTIAAVGTAILFLFKGFFISLYVKNPQAIAAATTRIYYVAIPYFLAAFMEIGSGVVRGFGRSLTSTIVSLVGSCVFRIVWIITVCSAYPALEVIYLSYPISWGLTALIHFIVSLFLRRKYMKKYPESKLTQA